jgi:FMN phosphatase YigB (HAD superfamily)
MLKAVVFDAGETLVNESRQWRMWADWLKVPDAFFNKNVDQLDLAPSSIAYVGDRLDNDVLPALAAGFIAVFIRRGPWGFPHSQRPEAIQAHLRIESLTELPGGLEAFRKPA